MSVLEVDEPDDTLYVDSVLAVPVDEERVCVEDVVTGQLKVTEEAVLDDGNEDVEYVLDQVQGPVVEFKLNGAVLDVPYVDELPPDGIGTVSVEVSVGAPDQEYEELGYVVNENDGTGDPEG